MRILLLMAFLAFSADGAQASELSDNPAFCYGFLSAAEPVAARALAARRAAVDAQFNRTGPKDSTDGRGFDDWARIGAEAAAEPDTPARAALVRRCRLLLDRAG